MTVKGFVFDIQRFSIHDGPGIRTTVFLKGCPLRCQWCHNPEGLRPRQELSYDAARCICCGACSAACPNQAHQITGEGHLFLRDRCEQCGACASACAPEALTWVGKIYDVEDVLKVVRRDRPFYETGGGGMTLSGGEPTMQHDFALALAQAAHREGIHVAMETCGHADAEKLLAYVEPVDLFLFDVKELDARLHREFTGVGNERIIDNLRALDAAGAQLILRCPLIPGKNLREQHFLGIAALANSLTHVLGIELEPYHPLGLHKSERVGMDSPYENDRIMERMEAEAGLAILEANTKIPAKIS